METYKIIRFFFKGKPQQMKSGLSLAEAQAYCQDEETEGKCWFDGYEKE